MLKKNLLPLLGSLSAFLIAGAAFAATSSSHATTNNLQQFQLKPQFNLWGFTGNRTFGKAQMRLPIFGNENKVFYGIVQGDVAGSDSSWLGSAGLGYRQIIGNHIYGGYLLTDYQNSASNNGFWIANPGLEMLGKVWDFNANFYIPISSKQTRTKTDWADNFGNYNYESFTGHNEYDAKLKQYEEVGRGLALEVGRTIPHFSKAKAYLGGYHFDTKHTGSTNGVAGKITYNLNKYATLELADTYDNTHHNTALIGIRINFGNYSSQDKEKFGLSSRLLDPIERINTGNMGVPIKDKFVATSYGKEHDNIWFFKQGQANAASNAQNAQSQGSGTYEDPFVGFNKNNDGVVLSHQNAGSVDKYPQLFFTAGTYNFQDFTSRGIKNRFSLPNGWGLYGRSADYKTPALGDERPLFQGGLDLNYAAGQGKATNTLNSIRIWSDKPSAYNKSQDTTGGENAVIYAKNAADVVFKNVAVSDVFQIQDGKAQLAGVGIYADNSTLNFAQLNDVTSGENSVEVIINSMLRTESGYAIYAQNHSSVNFLSGKNYLESFCAAPPPPRMDAYSGSGYSHGIYANNSIVNFSGGKNTIESVYYRAMKNPTSAGIKAVDATVNFKGGTNFINSQVDVSTDSGDISTFGIDANHSTINFSGGTNTLQSIGCYASNNIDNFGIKAQNQSTINFSGGTNIFKVLDTLGAAWEYHLYGIYTDNSQLNFSGGKNTVLVQTQSDHAHPYYLYGIYAINHSVLNVQGGDNAVLMQSHLNGDSYHIFGIWGDTTSRLQIKGKDVTNLPDLLNYIQIKRGSDNYPFGLTASSDSEKIIWGDKKLDWDA